MNYKELREGLEKKAMKYLELLEKENIKYTLDVDGSMYFFSEEDAAKAEELEKKLHLKLNKENRIKLEMTKEVKGIEVEYGKLPGETIKFYFRTRNLYDTKKFEEIIDLFTNEIIQQESEPEHSMGWRIVKREVTDWNQYLQTVIVTFEVKEEF